jgi:hypothetical protein
MRTFSFTVGAAVVTGATAFSLAGGPAAAAPSAVEPGNPYASPTSDGLGIAGSANHRRPMAGEMQILRWTVTNTGTRAWHRVRLRMSVPRRWRPRHPAGCRAAGRWLSCELGGLAARAHRRITVRLVVAGPSGVRHRPHPRGRGRLERPACLRRAVDVVSAHGGTATLTLAKAKIGRKHRM